MANTTRHPSIDQAEGSRVARMGLVDQVSVIALAPAKILPERKALRDMNGNATHKTVAMTIAFCLLLADFVDLVGLDYGLVA